LIKIFSGAETFFEQGANNFYFASKLPSVCIKQTFQLVGPCTFSCHLTSTGVWEAETPALGNFWGFATRIALTYPEILIGGGETNWKILDSSWLRPCIPDNSSKSPFFQCGFM